jgi:hypothetical protein
MPNEKLAKTMAGNHTATAGPTGGPAHGRGNKRHQEQPSSAQPGKGQEAQSDPPLQLSVAGLLRKDHGVVGERRTQEGTQRNRGDLLLKVQHRWVQPHNKATQERNWTGQETIEEREDKPPRGETENRLDDGNRQRRVSENNREQGYEDAVAGVVPEQLE